MTMLRKIYKKCTDMRHKKTTILSHRTRNSIFQLKDEIYISTIMVGVGCSSSLIPLQLWKHITGPFMFLPAIADYPVWFLALLYANVAMLPILSIIIGIHFGFIIPLARQEMKKNRHHFKQTVYKSIFLTTFAGGFMSGTILNYILSVPVLHASMLHIIGYSIAFIVPALFGCIAPVYQFLYKPARAGKLPRWVQRVLGRRNSIVQLRDDIAALADSHDADHPHFTKNT